MPMELLQQISKKALPLTVTDIESIDKLRVLQASGHVAAILSAVYAKKQSARVLAITELGRTELKRLETADEAHRALADGAAG